MSRLFYIAGGGTAGHVNPALAIAEALKAKYEDCEIKFFVTEAGVERKMVKEAGYDAIVIKASRLPRNPIDAVKFGTYSINGYKTCLNELKEKNVSAVIGTGGFVCGPLLLAASKLKIPYVIHEQNAFPGKANRFFAKKAAAVCISFKMAEQHFHTKAPILYTGNPIKKVFFDMSPEEARKVLNIPSNKFLVLIMGGSLGAGQINQAIVDIFNKNLWQKMKRRYPELMICASVGPKKYESIMSQISIENEEDIQISPYLESHLWLPACDLYIGRAGASSCFESAATGTPTIFLPYPEAADNHQYYNAKSFAKDHAAILIEDKDFNAQVLLDHIRYLIENRTVMFNMSKRTKENAMPDAANRIVDVIDKYAK